MREKTDKCTHPKTTRWIGEGAGLYCNYCHLRLDEFRISTGGVNHLKLAPKGGVDWEAIAKEYRRMYEHEVGSDCKPEEAMTDAGKTAIAQTHVLLDDIVRSHTTAEPTQILVPSYKFPKEPTDA